MKQLLFIINSSTVLLLLVMMVCCSEVDYKGFKEIRVVFLYDNQSLNVSITQPSEDGCIEVKQDEIEIWWNEDEKFEYESANSSSTGGKISDGKCSDVELEYEGIGIQSGTFNFSYSGANQDISLKVEMPSDFSASISPNNFDEIVLTKEFTISWNNSQVNPPLTVFLGKIDSATSDVFPQCELVESGDKYATYNLPDTSDEYFSEYVPIEVFFANILNVDKCEGVKNCQVAILKDFYFFDYK